VIFIKRFAILIFLIFFFSCSISFAEDEVGTQTEAEAKVACLIDQLIDQRQEAIDTLAEIKNQLGLPSDAEKKEIIAAIQKLTCSLQGAVRNLECITGIETDPE